MWTVGAGAALAAFVRAQTGRPWSEVKRWIETGKVFVDGERAVDAGRRLAAGARVELRMAAPRRREGPEVRIVFEDAHLVVIDKPAGVSSVPYDEKEAGTAMDLVRDAWRRQGKPATSVPLHVVHRIDKDTSGLLVFAKTKRAETGLAAQLRAHAVARLYVCVAHGDVAAARIESELVDDRGDGLRGSSRRAGQGKRAVTHVAPMRRLRGATLCEVRLETGKTHQIRIHLAEAGHPLVGERVYIRDYAGPLIASPRLLLHAATLGFAHPVTGTPMSFSSPLPGDFSEVTTRLA
ncbi:MAG TPA: RluA family pseudouridine synthase [Haliangiales bacterium]|nr:RluA family pseudouridine synthase [Haliangiales bacterium]